MQELRHSWKPPEGVLGRIVTETNARVRALVKRRDEVGQHARRSALPRSMTAALGTQHVAVIAEIKRRSPSKGVISSSLSAEVHSRAYAEGGAAAISVLTEPVHFGGSIEDLKIAARTVVIPVLRKDFIVHELQVAETRAAGASAVLLIVRALSPMRLPILVSSAREWGVDALVEIRSEQELHRALGAGAMLIGVNSRDLESLEIDHGTHDRLLPLIPPESVAVAESAIQTTEDVQRLADAGADAVLIGSSLSGAIDPASAVRALTGVPRCGRDGRH